MRHTKQLTSLAVVVVLLSSLGSLAQGSSAASSIENNVRYKLVDLGTFGGPLSTLVFFQPGVINRFGTVVGGADTSTPDPYAPTCNFFTPNCVVHHAFEWKRGVMRDLGSLPGTNSSFAWWINERGWIAGGSENGVIDPIAGVPEVNAVLWHNGRINNLGTLGGNQSVAFGVNSQGQVTGYATNAIPDPWPFFFSYGTQMRAYLWQNGRMRDLGTLGGPDSGGLYVNDRGHVSGVSFTSDVPEASTGIPPVEPFLWDGRKMLSIGTLGGVWGQVLGMNNKDQVIGNSSTADGPAACLIGGPGCHAFLWERGRITDLGTLGGTFAIPTMLNELGDVVGAANTVNDETVRAIRWKEGAVQDLGGVDGDPCSWAWGTNNKGQIVGISVPMCDLSIAPRAFLWEHGEMIDLNTRIVGDANFQLVYAEAINDRGEIAGIGVSSGVSPGDVESLGHAFVLIPCDREDSGCDDHGLGKTRLTTPSSVSASSSSAKPSYGNATAQLLSAFRVHFMTRQGRPLGAGGPK